MKPPEIDVLPDTVVKGFRFGATAAGIRKDGRQDLALVVADADCVTAGVLTRNLVRAAPVELMARRLVRQRARALLVNSGCANACTGDAGMQAALDSCAHVASALEIPAEMMLAASTGVIGALLPVDKVRAAVPALVKSLSPTGWDAFARAIMTTDRWPKVAHRLLPDSYGRSSLLCIAKGAGMIHPDMGPPQATMLAFAFTDAVMDGHALSKSLHAAVDTTFNACSVDGDTSTNDCAVLLASGASGHTPSSTAFTSALESAFDELARSMVADGEGAEHLAEIRVQGLDNEADARTVARTIATSLLVKTALFGQDINWGRILGAAGRAGVRFDPAQVNLWVGDVQIVSNGVGVGAEAEKAANAILTQDAYVVTLELGQGSCGFRYLTSDLGHGYVDVNAGYRS
ncbi:MAG: bifunctional glutamate N-acetyltransferase/amino-acid acetyltransferase ArgJ [Polyangiaceae bacterium]